MMPGNPLSVISWEDLEKLNQELCGESRYQHGRTSDGYDPAKALSTQRQSEKILGLAEVVETMRELHKLAPFLFLNGNTFAEMGTRMAGWFHKGTLTALERSAVGHHIAGVRIMDMRELREIFAEADKN